MLAKCFLVSGRLTDGKTRLISDLVHRIRSTNEFPCYGFMEPCVKEQTTRVGYDLVTDVNGDTERLPFCRLKEQISLSEGMLFQFDQTVIDRALQRFQSATFPQRPSLLYFDEFGRLEANERGLWKPIQFLISHFQRNSIPYSCVITTRSANVSLTKAKLPSFDNVFALPASDAAQSSFIDTVIASLRGK